MTQPEPTLDQRVVFQQQVSAVAEAVSKVVQPIGPHVVVVALITVIAALAGRTQFSREQLVGMLIEAYDQTRNAAENMPEALKAQIAALVAENPPDLPQRVQALITEYMQTQGRSPAAPPTAPPAPAP